MRRALRASAGAAWCLALLPAIGRAEAPRPYAITEEREPCAAFERLRSPFFGDLHVHTVFSLDANLQGTRSTPRDAYRFARGERIPIPPYDASGRPLRSLRIDRPLDFTAVTDHAEFLGEVRICSTPGLAGYSSLTCFLFRHWKGLAFPVMNSKNARTDPTRFDFCGEGGRRCLEAAATPWGEIRAAAEEVYDRTAACTFTSFVGYEWTAAPQSNNLHRNVIFRNASVPELPTSYLDASRTERLWSELRDRCLDAGRGCDVLTIPHNSNLSGGLMFETVTSEGEPLSAADARRRATWEPLVEIMQHKGESECDLTSSPEDELCDFEKLPFQNFAARYVSAFGRATPANSYVRSALKEGLVQLQTLGANPFHFGFIGSTDTHLAVPGATGEGRHPGHGGAGARPSKAALTGLPDRLEMNPGGLAVLWAEENSRDALFAAMRRREAYATSGTRPTVRFFGGWSYRANLCERGSLVATGYAAGVPMGGDLPPSPADRPYGGPVFAVSALRDPGSASAPGGLLQRIQIVKGWVEDGVAREAVYEIAGDPKNGARVDLASCEPEGPGFDTLCSVWVDPAFDPDAPAFYYARVLENPSCRWSALVCNAHGVDCSDRGSIPSELEACCAADHHWTIQERAWTSPIWYEPPPRGSP